MKNLNVGLVRVLQFVVFVLFTFIVLVYFSALLLLPIAILVQIINLLHLFGMGTLFGAIIGVPVVAYLGKIVYTTPGLLQMLIDNGIDLVNTGKLRVEAFNKFAEEAK
jgi:glycosyltransferase involved in cell wall biosynthesis